MGVLLCILSAACYATLGVFGKLCFDTGMGVLTLLTLRFGMAAVGFGALTAVVHRRGTARPPLERRAAVTALGLGCVGFSAQSGLYFGALDHIDLSLLSLLLYTYPAFVTIAAVTLGREVLTRRRVTALTAASAGVALVLIGAGGVGADALGIAMAVGAALVYTTYILVADGVIDDVPPLPFSTLIMTGAFTTLLAAGLVSGSLELGFDAAGWGWLAAMSICSTIVPVLAFFAGMRRVGPSNTSILSTFEPPVTVLLAFLVFSERLGALQLVGGVLVLSAVVLLQSSVRGAERARAAAVAVPLAERLPQPVPG
jgi:drug/metabolite transporter (DMT)-like permease